METQKENEDICCLPFDSKPWDDQIFTWENKKFIKDKVFTIFYMPVNFGQVMKRLDKTLKKANANFQDSIGLSDHTSKWNMDLYLSVDKDIPGIENTTFSGKFYSKVYEGPFQDTGKWCKDYEGLAKSKGLTITKEYMWYTTCPKCAKKYGKNYVVIVGKID
jgi:effector-binding domain-containing protein